MDSVEKIREVVRSTVVESRLASRDKLWKNKRKALQDVVDIGREVKKDEVVILANKLKSKSLLQDEDLALLKIAFVQGEHNIVAFLKVKGALHGLVRELSSSKPNFELLAAECICNLALGDAKSCLVIAKAAGPYLITILSGFNHNLKVTSVWALGNLVGSGEKTWKIVQSQGLLNKLLQLIVENDDLSDLNYNSLTALSQFLYVGRKFLTVEEVQSISKTISSLKNSQSKGLRVSGYLLSCMEAAEKELIENKFYIKCLECLVGTELTVETVTEFTACVRTMANLVAELSGTCAMEVLQNWKCVQDSIQKILSISLRNPVEKCYCLSVGKMSYYREASALGGKGRGGPGEGNPTGGAPTQVQRSTRLVVHHLKGAWTMSNREVAFALFDSFMKMKKQLKKNLSTEALKGFRKDRTTIPLKSRNQTTGGQVNPPAPPPTAAAIQLQDISWYWIPK